jgi:chemotaxis protein methyltransferase CheR
MAISPPDFAYISELARRRAAIVLEPGKEYLVESRLSGVAKVEGHAGLGELVARLKSTPESAPLHAKVIDALTTNETFFFRDHHPFEALRNTILPKLVRDRAASRKLNIWCAACSTGQEPYSVAMLLREHFPVLASWNVKITATDLSPRVLGQAREGLYSQMEVNRGLPALYLIKHFRQEGGGWRLNEDIRKLVDFQELNLIQPWVNHPVFDIVFLRNVMIYFDIPTKRTILKNIRRHLARDGYLFLGAAETVINMDAGFVPVSFGKATAYAVEPQS